MDYEERAGQMRKLAFIDEADMYEVDQTGIYLDADGKFVLLTASGCSCWEGEYDEEVFETLELLEKSLVQKDRTYSPSLEGVKQLMEEARREIASP